MKSEPRIPLGHELAAKWDGMTFMERLNLVIGNSELFWSLRLITDSEIAMVDSMHVSDREYIVEREDQPLFTSLHLKKTVAAQQHRDKLEAALRAVFASPKVEILALH